VVLALVSALMTLELGSGRCFESAGGLWLRQALVSSRQYLLATVWSLLPIPVALCCLVRTGILKLTRWPSQAGSATNNRKDPCQATDCIDRGSGDAAESLCRGIPIVRIAQAFVCKRDSSGSSGSAVSQMEGC